MIKTNKSCVKFLTRPDDYAIFFENEDGTYTHEPTVNVVLTNKYTKEQLLNLGFVERTFKNLQMVREKQKEHAEFINWYTRSDGHDGIKGGSFEEFLLLK